jgi:hypothetical protein
MYLCRRWLPRICAAGGCCLSVPQVAAAYPCRRWLQCVSATCNESVPQVAAVYPSPQVAATCSAAGGCYILSCRRWLLYILRRRWLLPAPPQVAAHVPTAMACYVTASSRPVNSIRQQHFLSQLYFTQSINQSIHLTTHNQQSQLINPSSIHNQHKINFFLPDPLLVPQGQSSAPVLALQSFSLSCRLQAGGRCCCPEIRELRSSNCP